MLIVDPLNRPNARELLDEEIYTIIDYEKKAVWRLVYVLNIVIPNYVLGQYFGKLGEDS